MGRKPKPVEEKTNKGLHSAFNRKYTILTDNISAANYHIEQAHDNPNYTMEVDLGDLFNQLKVGASFLEEHHLEILKREKEKGLFGDFELREQKVRKIKKVLRNLKSWGFEEFA